MANKLNWLMRSVSLQKGHLIENMNNIFVVAALSMVDGLILPIIEQLFSSPTQKKLISSAGQFSKSKQTLRSGSNAGLFSVDISFNRLFVCVCYCLGSTNSTCQICMWEKEKEKGMQIGIESSCHSEWVDQEKLSLSKPKQTKTLSCNDSSTTNRPLLLSGVRSFSANYLVWKLITFLAIVAKLAHLNHNGIHWKRYSFGTDWYLPMSVDVRLFGSSATWIV